MRHTRVIVAILALPLVISACGGGDDASTGGAPAAGADVQAVDPAEAAVITGTVRFEGTAPAPEAIDMSEEPTCAGKHSGTPVRERVAVNDNGTLRNVFVYVKEGLGDRRFPTSQDAQVIDQDGCVYHPHVTGVQTGQPVVFRNSDGLLHNINARPTANRSFNISQPQNMDSPPRTFTQPEVMIPVRCDVHGWMESFIGVVAHPYFAVTGEDGSFRIENLPPGDYTVEAWHETYGTQTMQVSVAAQQTSETSFTYNAGMTGAFVPLGAPIDPHGQAHAAPAHTIARAPAESKP
jgi:plastocyanin